MKMEDLRYHSNPFKPRNRIEEALRSAQHLPEITKLEPEIPEPEDHKSVGTSRRFKEMATGFGIVILLAAIVSGSSLIYKKYQETKVDSPDTTLADVRNLIDLPEDETPTIATVNDLTSLQTEPFFKDAEIGDKVLIYTAVKKAILYRPRTDKIILIAPIR